MIFGDYTQYKTRKTQIHQVCCTKIIRLLIIIFFLVSLGCGSGHISLVCGQLGVWSQHYFKTTRQRFIYKFGQQSSEPLKNQQNFNTSCCNLTSPCLFRDSSCVVNSRSHARCVKGSINTTVRSNASNVWEFSTAHV